jgi:hypothetical protein
LQHSEIPTRRNIEMGNLRAGAAWASITPEEHYAMGGYTRGDNFFLTMLRPRRSTGLHDDLQARALVLSDGETTLALVAVNVIGLFHDDVVAIRELAVEKTGLPSLEAIVAATHTQAGPDTYGVYGGVPRRYRAFIYQQASEAIAQAAAKMAPARVGFAMTQVEGLVGNRRTSQGPVDPGLAVMTVDGDRTIATLVNFTCHTNVLGPKNTLLSADWPFYLQEALEKERGGLTLFFNGAVGDLHPLQLIRDPEDELGLRTFEEAEKLGHAIAEAALATLPQAEFVDEVTIALEKRTVDIPVTNRLLKLMRWLGILKRTLYDGQVRTETWSVRLGPAQVVTIPGQPFCKLGLEVKEAMSGKYRFLLGLANDELAYIVPPDEWDPARGEETVSVGINTWPALRAQIPL